MVCNDILRDIPERDHHVHTYVLCENRSLIQRLMLMRSAIMFGYIAMSSDYTIMIALMADQTVSFLVLKLILVVEL